MSRRNASKKRLPAPDAVYNSRLVSMFIVHVLQDGKKSKCVIKIVPKDKKVPTFQMDEKCKKKRTT